jgi:hypothetical protein
MTNEKCDNFFFISPLVEHFPFESHHSMLSCPEQQSNHLKVNYPHSSMFVIMATLSEMKV